METLMNTLNRLIISTSSHANGFKNLGEKKLLKNIINYTNIFRITYGGMMQDTKSKFSNSFFI
jgi:hypothetical protein